MPNQRNQTTRQRPPVENEFVPVSPTRSQPGELQRGLTTPGTGQNRYWTRQNQPLARRTTPLPKRPRQQLKRRKQV